MSACFLRFHVSCTWMYSHWRIIVSVIFEVCQIHFRNVVSKNIIAVYTLYTLTAFPDETHPESSGQGPRWKNRKNELSPVINVQEYVVPGVFRPPVELVEIFSRPPFSHAMELGQCINLEGINLKGVLSTQLHYINTI